MRSGKVILRALLCLTLPLVQAADTHLRAELEALHAEWFRAFDRSDGATMDQMEMDNLVLVMPVGFIWAKTMARGAEPPKQDSQATRALSDVTVRQFGDTAILTGILTTKSSKESSQQATTVVFVHSAAKWKIASAQWSPVTGGM